jgi:hypothetical protein
MRRGFVIGPLVAAWTLAAAPAARAQEADEADAPELYYGLGVGTDVLGNNDDLDVCAAPATDPGTQRCRRLTGPAGGGAALFFGARPWGWLGLQLTYDAFFHQGADQDPYNLATLQSLRADAGSSWCRARASSRTCRRGRGCT